MWSLISWCQKNRILASLVKKLGLETTPHSHPYRFRWFHDDVEMKINWYCKIWFNIKKEFVDKVTCEVVPLNICQVILRSPYLWDRDAIYFHRPQKYQLQKDVSFSSPKIRDSISLTEDLISISQAKIMVNACWKIVALTSRCKEPKFISNMRKEEEKLKGAILTLKPQEDKESPQVDGDQQREPYQNGACRWHRQLQWHEPYRQTKAKPPTYR